MEIAFISAAIGILVFAGTLGMLYAIRRRRVDLALIRGGLEESQPGWRDYIKRTEVIFRSPEPASRRTSAPMLSTVRLPDPDLALSGSWSPVIV